MIKNTAPVAQEIAEYPAVGRIGRFDSGSEPIPQRLIGNIYEASLDNSMWSVVLEEIAEFVGGRAVVLVVKDAASAGVKAKYQFGINPRAMRLYSETYSKFDPLAVASLLEVGQVASLPDIVSYEEYCKGRFHQEWAAPQGWCDVASVVLEKSRKSCVLLSVVRSKADGMVDDEMRRRISLLVPHVRRTVLIGRIAHLQHAFCEVFNGLSVGLFLVDAKAHVIHANTAGQAILGEGNVLRLSRGELVTGEKQINKALRDAFAAAERGDATPCIKGNVLPLIASDGERYVVHLLPLTSDVRLHAGDRERAVAALFARKLSLKTPSASEVIGLSYRLTPTELRVLLALVDVGGIPEVAAALGAAETTIKVHVSRLLEKTKTNRHADLIKVVAGFASPLIG
jgi:DNA-binding CsgD family transcriptional regulator